MNNNPDLSLSNCSIVVTRPASQAQGLAELIRQSGGEPVYFPLLQITPLENYHGYDLVIDTLDDFDWAIFISRNAVHYGLTRLLSRRSLPQRIRYAAIGPATAAALGDFDIHEVLTPIIRFDSESLLNLPEMQDVDGKHCVIFRGVGGRDLLKDTLVNRGAEVVFAECYQRTRPDFDHKQLIRLQANNCRSAVVITSSEALQNWLVIIDKLPWLKAIPIFVNHPRIAQTVKQLQIITTDTPSDLDMLATLEKFFKKS